MVTGELFTHWRRQVYAGGGGKNLFSFGTLLVRRFTKRACMKRAFSTINSSFELNNGTQPAS
jgi:hypothetical protein